ncbi:cysteine-rich CWC family protein [Paenibacillus sp. NRS-1760]|uniref:cysteine-rich CWC family protein n=1 Tax=unclassified Paenibacillus TaxID=185978 RepID=UPI003D2A6B43
MNCPLCNGPNDCAMEENNAAKDCWCFQKSFPSTLLEAVPEELKNKACICRNCLSKVVEEQN